tara:strand:- start:4817 stop:6805 length:1989 start_codon:yes stop_codon:yes gene_type:complete
MADNKNNPRNSKNILFRKLTRLLSGPVVNYRRQLPRQPHRREISKYNIRSSSGQQFKKSEYNPYDSIQANYMSNQNRADRYVDFDQMEYTPEIASAMDIYADEMTTSSDLQPLMRISCHNEEIKTVLENLYKNILNIEFNLFGWARTMCKYGDFFLYLDIDDQEGIQYAVGLPPQEIERLEGEDKTNPNYIQYQWNTGGITFENWQIAHFRILGNDKYSPYGTSILEPARRIWRQLTLMEDAVMAYRIVRSPERRVFYIDVGNIPPADVEQYMQKVMTQMKRNQVVDHDTGRVDLRYNPMSVEEDYFIPVRGDTSSKVESLPGGTYTGDIDDIKYLRDKLFSALKIPASYLAQTEGGAEEDKTTLAQKDIRFARTIQRLQRVVISELEKIGIVHLFTLGYRGSDLVSFKIALNNPSKLAEMQELEHWRTKFDVASAATEGYFSKRWISDNLFSMSEEEFVRCQREMFYDRKFEASLERTVEEVTAGDDPGGGGLADLEGLDDAGDLTGDLAPEEEAVAAGDEELAVPEAGADEPADTGALLAAPAKRDDGKEVPIKLVRKRGTNIETTTPKSKKWYMPEKNPNYAGSARQRHYKGVWADELTKNTTRNIFKGADDMRRLAKGISESLESNYKRDEDNLLKVDHDIKQLISEMELLETKKNEV